MENEEILEEPTKKGTDQQNDPEEAIDTPGEVPESNDEKIDQDFPGYPHYPAKDDILNPGNKQQRVDVEIENLSRSNKIDPLEVNAIKATPADTTHITGVTLEDDIEIVKGTEADVTAEDLKLLGPRDQDMDMGEDEGIQPAGWRLSLTGDQLDVPGDEADPTADAMGQGDEENSYYSLGGDRMEHLDEDRG